MCINLPLWLFWRDYFSAFAIWFSKTFVLHLASPKAEGNDNIWKRKGSTYSANNFRAEQESPSIKENEPVVHKGIWQNTGY